MRTPRPRSSRPLVARALVLGGVATVAAALVVPGPVSGARDGLARAASSAWQGLVGNRPKAAAGQRMIVVLEAPSLAERMASAETPPGPEEQKRWVAEADAAQRVLLARLAARGVELRRERWFTRTLNGFSAQVDARALAELERVDGVAGVYPVRVVYPASVTARALSSPEFRAGAGRRPEVGLAGFDGSGETIALLDSGVELDHPFLNGRVLPGYDLVDRDRRASPEPKPDEPARPDSHGTRMAGILVGSGGPAGLHGIAPQARVLPLRILDWERTEDGRYALLGRGDVLLAGLERAVDPDGNGDVEDAATVALAAVVEPFASFADSPEARAVDGAARLGTLVVAAAGNDGRGGSGFGTVGAPAGAPAAVAVGAVDSRAEVLDVRTRLRVGASTLLDRRARVLGVVRPTGALPAAALVGPTLAEPRRAPDALADGTTLADFFDSNGLSTVAGHAAVVPAPAGRLEETVRNAASAGAAAVLVYGTEVPAGSLDLEEATAIPVVAVPAEAGRALVEGLARGDVASVEFARVRRVGNGALGRVASFSSGGVAFGGNAKPDLVAPGVGIATADAGTNADGSARYATATGSSAAAAVVAGSAAVLAQARPGLTVTELRSLLVGSARQFVRDGVPDPVTQQGAGLVDPAAAAAAEVAVAPVSLAYGRAGRDGWQVTQTVSVRNLSTRVVDIGFGITRDRWGAPEISFAASPANLALRPGTSAAVTLVASARGPLAGDAAGAFVVTPTGSRAVRVPWAVSFRTRDSRSLLGSVRISERAFEASDSSPSVLSFRVGAVGAGRAGSAVEAVQLLEAELATAGGRRLGILGRLRHLLPGRYAFGLTGRGPRGNELGPGRYVLTLRAHPVPGDAGAQATSVAVPFTIRGE